MSCFSAASGRVLGVPSPGETSWASESMLGSARQGFGEGLFGGSWLLGSSSGSRLVFLTLDGIFQMCCKEVVGLRIPKGSLFSFLPPSLASQVLQPNSQLSPREHQCWFPLPSCPQCLEPCLGTEWALGDGSCVCK